MTVRGVRVTRRTPKTLRPELALCSGPATLAQSGGGTLGALYGSVWAVALFTGGPQLLQLSGGVWTERSDPDALADLGAGVSRVSLAFDQAARPVLAWEVRGSVFVRQFSPQAARYVTRGPWAGRCPLLFADALVGVPLGASDVLLVHLDGPALLGRAQRDLYATAYPLATPGPGAVLDQVVSLGNTWAVLGESATGQALALLSGLYDLAQRGAMTGGALPGAGSYTAAVQDNAQSEPLPVLGGAQPTAGSYTTALIYSAQSEPLPMLGGAQPTAGSYTPALLVLTVADPSSGAALPASGVYALGVVYAPVNTPDASSGAALPASGTYGP